MKAKKVETLSTGAIPTDTPLTSAILTGTYDTSDGGIVLVPGNATTVTSATSVVSIFSDASMLSGVFLKKGTNLWSTTCDRNLKQDFVAVDTRDMLERLMRIPINTYRYKSSGADTQKCIGPTAQDWQAEIQLGQTSLSITTGELDGVALASIQGLNLKLEEQCSALNLQCNDLTAKCNDLSAQCNGLMDKNNALRNTITTLRSETISLRATLDSVLARLAAAGL